MFVWTELFDLPCCISNLSACTVNERDGGKVGRWEIGLGSDCCGPLHKSGRTPPAEVRLLHLSDEAEGGDGCGRCGRRQGQRHGERK